MAVLIKGFKYPRKCTECLFRTFALVPVPGQIDKVCILTNKSVKDVPDLVGHRADFCPLVLCEDDRVPCVDESLTDIMEEVCEICRYVGDYKDQDELFEKRCNHCKVEKKVSEVLYGRKD